MRRCQLLAIFVSQVLYSQCFETVQHYAVPSGNRTTAMEPGQVEAFKEHALVSSKLVMELAKQQLKLLSGLTGTIIGGDLIADTPIGEITKYGLGGSPALSLNSGGSASTGEQTSIQQSTSPPSIHKPVRRKPHVGVAATGPGRPVPAEGVAVHKPTFVSVAPINRTTISNSLSEGHSSEDDYYDISWSLEPKPSTTTRHPLASIEDQSSEEHLFEGDQYIVVKKTTPAPWEVNPLLADPFHGAPTPGPPAVPFKDPPTDQLDPVMYPVILPDGVLQRPQTTAEEEEKRQIYNPLAAIAKTGSNGHW